MRTHTIYRYSETDHLSGERTSTRYTAQSDAPESLSSGIGIIKSRNEAEPAYTLQGDVEIGYTEDGTECVWPAGSEIGEPLDVVMHDPRLRGDLGIKLERIE